MPEWPGLAGRQLKDQIRGLMIAYKGIELIAFRWASIDDPVVMTSRGPQLRRPSYDSRWALAFIEG